MRVYCTDGTVVACERFEVSEFGVTLYGQAEAETRDRYEDTEPKQTGFVPHDRLWYVLPKTATPEAGVGVGHPPPTRAASGQRRPPSNAPRSGSPSDQSAKPSRSTWAATGSGR